MNARVLVVDDDLTIAEVVGDYLRALLAHLAREDTGAVRDVSSAPGPDPAEALAPA